MSAIREISILALSLVAAATTAAADSKTGGRQRARPQAEGAIFWIGKPDGAALEFGPSRGDYREYPSEPVVFTAGEDTLSAWPFYHPADKAWWAGSTSHTHRINFKSASAPAQSLYLRVGLVDAFDPPLLTVTVNGKEVGQQRVPASSVSGSKTPSDISNPSVMVFPLPRGTLRAGDNSLELRLNDGGWIIYDYILLGTSQTPPPAVSLSERLHKKSLPGPMAGVEEIVFAVRQPGKDNHWYANFGYWAADAKHTLYGEGGKLHRLNLRSGKLTVLLEDSKGSVRDPQVHYDGKKILFCYRRGGSHYYHLYEINADGGGLKQLTDGPFDDIEPTYMPDGNIMFVSSRCKRWVNCMSSQVAILYRCDADGRNILPVSSNNEQDNTPWPLPDGRILYTRWEYVDRNQMGYHHLWTANPDGTGQMVYFGNQYPGIVMSDAKPIPGTNKVVAAFGPGHGMPEHGGELTIVDPSAGPDAPSFARRIGRGLGYRDPWAFSEDCFLASFEGSLVVVDAQGRAQQIYKLAAEDVRAGLQCYEPRPLRPRPREIVIPPRVDLSQGTGRLFLSDIYQGRNMTGVKRGEIKKLLVLETLPKPVNFSGGPEPLSYSGSYTLERILGTIPVEPDGSAYMELPALRSLFFVALDEKDMAVKRMQSFVTVQPGEVTGCVGCHEQRVLAPQYSAANSMALRSTPSQIEPIPDVPEVIDFPRDVQPILDRHCLKCHDYDKPGGRVILSGDRGPFYSHSYFALTMRGQVSDGRNLPQSSYPPRTLGSSASLLIQKLSPSHHEVRVSPLELKTVRFWIETGAAYPGTYAALGTGMIGGYLDTSPKDTAHDLEAVGSWASTKAATEVIKRRCTGCHAGNLTLPMSVAQDQLYGPWDYLRPIDYRRRFSRHLLFNLTRPEKSPMLLAPLSRQGGGHGVCKTSTMDDSTRSQPAGVFAGTDDPDYVKILTSIIDAKRKLDEVKRFDMPGFRPRTDWVREMKRYGVLPANQNLSDPIDTYAVEKKYWKSLWYSPR